MCVININRIKNPLSSILIFKWYWPGKKTFSKKIGHAQEYKVMYAYREVEVQVLPINTTLSGVPKMTDFERQWKKDGMR